MKVHVGLVEWLEENADSVDWQFFASPWDAMQKKHNPFRDDQIRAIVGACGVLERQSPAVLDLGCGPGILGRRIVGLVPTTEYFGLDGDPLMLAAAQRLLSSQRAHWILNDLRSFGWALQYPSKFDCVVSLTALHWLSKDHLKQLYRVVFTVIKPGGSFMVGDPYLPENAIDRSRLSRFQDGRAISEKGLTWGAYWNELFQRIRIKDVYEDYHADASNQRFEGSDDGYTLQFHLSALDDAGFSASTVPWKSGLRAVYGGIKSP
jgi:SAM-dependent methyltransferase